MTAPERIEIYIVGYEQNAQYDPYWHMPSGDDCAIEYIRADLAAIATQPDPRDEVIAKMVDALDDVVKNENWIVNQKFKGKSEWFDLSMQRAALAAEKAVLK